MNLNKEVCIMFSGGSDSTLAAALLTKDFETIHLLTFKHSAIAQPEKSKINLERLQKKYTNNKFIYQVIDVEDYFHKFYYTNYLSNFFKFGLYIENICIACKLSMFTGAVKYCLKNNLHIIASGANKKSGIVFADQMSENVDSLRGCLKRHNIEYLIPTFITKRSDWELYELGVTPFKDVKFPSPIAYKEQPGCYCGEMHSIYVHGYFFPLYGKERFSKIAQRHFKEKLKIFNQYIIEFKGEQDILN